MIADKDWKQISKNIRRGNFYVFAEKLWQTYFNLVDHEGVDVVDEDWDYLIILDACRYDVFKEVNWLDGTLEKRISRGSMTAEWVRQNFQGYHDDIVYVSTSPFVTGIEEIGGFDAHEHFHDVIEVMIKNQVEPKGSAGVTHPQDVVDAAIDAHDQYPNKRLIIHFNQPHAPYIGEPRLTWRDSDMDIGDEFQMFTQPNVREAFRGNLELVLNHVEKLLDYLTGRVVISADHGEAFGEKGIISHPPGVYIPELVEVPWFIIKNGERPNIRNEAQSIDI